MGNIQVPVMNTNVTRQEGINSEILIRRVETNKQDKRLSSRTGNIVSSSREGLCEETRRPEQ